MADQLRRIRLHRLHFTVHYDPISLGNLDHQFCGSRRRQWAVHPYQSYLEHAAVFQVEPMGRFHGVGMKINMKKQSLLILGWLLLATPTAVQAQFNYTVTN